MKRAFDYPGYASVARAPGHYYDKRAYSRGAAWDDLLKRFPGKPGELNPWRKCHTSAYWGWYLK